ncbi:GntR family transcriptional regulator [Altererythrobacter sp. B11]|uniref:MocR-like pyridoxine biosynthesis transcription factor PdxR n=1 Tax=Altererythrobacter sp. B11 TaxID=2060312 RepID=UPI000DC71607|nr:PLP-dependent aminotransferase family protein [Altererythrobacter sp. B11]BBC71022.1 GntR family transcriptional regulator [Altererythrobacter sp. B11]
MRRPRNLALSRRISSDRSTPLYMQLVHALIHEIERGRLQPGSPLPSSRELSADLGLNRKTVVTAFDELVAQGWLQADGRRGTSVATNLPETRRQQPKPVEPGPRKPIYRFNAPPVRSLAVPSGSRIKLDEGSPDGSLFPSEVLARVYRRAALSAARDRRLGYRDPRGSEKLRERIALMLREERGLVLTPENICVTRGSQAAIALSTRLLARPGGSAVVEELTYEAAAAAFRAAGQSVEPLRMDERGLLVEDLERICRARPVNTLFLTPHHHFPTTVSLAPERRLRIIELARQFGFAIIEDDYDHEFRFGSQPLLPMASYAPDAVVYVGSLSKLILPALRVGYIAAPKPVIDALAHQVSLIDGMGSTLTEDAVALLLEEGEVRRHARKVTRIYGERRDAFAAKVQAALGDFAEARLPGGGLALWLRFHDLEALKRIEAGALKQGISFALSDSFRQSAEAAHGLRLGFASHPEAVSAAALDVMARLARGVTN